MMFIRSTLLFFTFSFSQFLFATAQESSSPKNRLSKESSPYLLQHASNPVDWFPWGEDAFDKAKKEKKLVFLSVGYAACHWCHVMERESFEDEEIAKYLNEHFVCIKVDREELPDVDQIYMTAVQIMTGRGGWPMSVFLTPEGKPIFGGTYFPARDGDRGAAPGFLSVIRRANGLWQNEREGLLAQADRVTQTLQSAMVTQRLPTEKNRGELQSLVLQTQQALVESFDTEFGGFGFQPSRPDRPKFPEPSSLIFLREQSQRKTLPEADRAQARQMLEKTLNAMIAGGIYDHVGGGFHRYSVDRFWKIPHFEKMLYDNAQLTQQFALAYETTANPEYRSIAEQTCEFVLRELQAPGGGFYSSLDADSEGEEGKFYLWGGWDAMVADLKGTPDCELWGLVYGLQSQPNFEGKYFAPQPGKPLSEWAKTKNLSYQTFSTMLAPTRQRLLQLRDKRVRPATDRKILTAWNGLMIAALADASRTMDRKDFLAVAEKCARFVLSKLVTEEGRLLRSHAAGQSKQLGYLDDYAYLTYGLIRLHHATKDPFWLAEATKWTKLQLKLFVDEPSGGFFFTSIEHPSLLVRFHDPTDGVTPSGDSVTASNLQYLASHGGEQSMADTLRKLIQASASQIELNPRASVWMSAEISLWLDRTQENPSGD